VFHSCECSPPSRGRKNSRKNSSGSELGGLVLADSLRTDKLAFRSLRLGQSQLVQLREASRIHDELKAERIALGNRLREQLQRYLHAGHFTRPCVIGAQLSQSTCRRSSQRAGRAVPRAQPSHARRSRAAACAGSRR
jgi:hypothetical protein